MSVTKQGEGLALQILFRPTDGEWVKEAENSTKQIRSGKKGPGVGKTILHELGWLIKDFIQAFGIRQTNMINWRGKIKV